MKKFIFCKMLLIIIGLITFGMTSQSFASVSAEVTSLYEVVNASCGSTIKLWAEVKNTNSTVFPSTYKVWFLLKGPDGFSKYVNSTNVSGLAVGGKKWYSINYTLPPDASGSFFYQARVYIGDSNDAVSNLSSSQSINVSCGGSAASAEVTSLYEVVNASCGSTIKLWAQVENTGSIDLSSTSKVWFYLKGEWIGSANVSGLGAATKKWYSINYTLPSSTSGQLTYWAKVTDGSKSISNLSSSKNFSISCNNDTIHDSFLDADFVLIHPGTFMMGSPDDEPLRGTDEVQHEVTLTKAYYMQTTELTQGQWKAVMGSRWNPNWSGTNFTFFENIDTYSSCGDDCPITGIAWKWINGDKIEDNFLNLLNATAKGRGEYRLPTEAEWEYAARAGTTTPFNTGICLSTDQANYDGDEPYYGCPFGVDRKRPMPVASFLPNAWGLYDMYGNVWEWCQDFMGSYMGPATDPEGPEEPNTFLNWARITRGGSWLSDASRLRSADRNMASQGYADGDIGFRLVWIPNTSTHTNSNSNNSTINRCKEKCKKFPRGPQRRQCLKTCS